jgi:hypothetical protein
MPATKPKKSAEPEAQSRVAKKSASPVNDQKAKPVTASKSKSKTATEEQQAAAPAEPTEKKKATRAPKAAVDTSAPVKASTGAKRGRKPKADKEVAEVDELDMSDIEDDLVGEPVAEAAGTTEKVKPLRMKISKAKERALMKEFGLRRDRPVGRRPGQTSLAAESADQAWQNPWLPDTRRDFRPLARQVGRCRNSGSGDLHAQRHGRGCVMSTRPDADDAATEPTTAQPLQQKKKLKKKPKPPLAPLTVNLAAPPTRCACTCAKWARSSCSRAKVKLKSPNALKAV